MALDKLTKVQSVGISSFIQVVGVVTATGGFVGDLTGNVTGNITGNVTGNITGTTSNASGATGDFSIADKIVHTGDTNTALRFPAADTITAETGGSERLRITSDGYARLTTANARLEWTASSGSNPFIRSIGSGQQELEFNIGGSERLRITSSGVTVTGSATVTEGLVLDGQNGSGKGLRLDLAGSGDYVIQETTTDDVVQFGGTGSSNFFTHNISSGSVGIATAVPSYRLDIGDGATDPANGYQLRVNAAGDYIFALQRQSNASFSIRNNSTGTVHLNTQNSKILSFGVSSGNSSGSIEDDVRIDSNGHLTILDGNLVVASGHGIDFSATGNGAGTMSSELLDDYEEGTWTPDLQFGGAKVGISYNNQYGRYTKIGNLVTVIGRITLASKGSSGGIARFFGLPYVTEPITGTQMSIGSLWYSGFNLQGSIVQVVIRTDGNGQSFVEPKGVTANAEDAIGDSDFANNTDMVFTISYRTS